MGELSADLRRALRSLFRAPGISAFIVLTLGLAIGANTAIFAVARSILLRPLPFAESERLVRVWESNPVQKREMENVSPANFLDWAAENDVFDAMVYWRDASTTLMGKQEPVEVTAQMVSPNFFAVLGVQAATGRTFQASEGLSRVAVLSHWVWQQQFAATSDIVGQTVLLNHDSYTIVGVMPAGFSMLGRSIGVWYPQPFSANQFRHRRYLEVAGRLKADVTIEQASRNLETIAARLAVAYPRSNSQWTIRLLPLHEQVVGRARKPIGILLAAAGVVLLIACANVAALLFARYVRRERELVIRSALGGRRGQLVRQLLVESLCLAFAASALGLVLARWGLAALIALEPGDLPRVREITIDPWVLLFAAGMALVTVALFGLAPALRSVDVHTEQALRENGGTRTSTGVRHRRILRLLTIGELALAVVLLVVAGLLLRGFLALRSVDPGFAAEHVAVGRISLDKTSYGEDARVVAYFEQVLTQLRAIPGVQAAAAVTSLPLNPVGIDFDTDYRVPGGSTPADEQQRPQVAFRVVTPGYIKTLGMRLIAGRDFNERDDVRAPRVVIVNQRMARQAWPGQSPIGQRLTLYSTSPPSTGEVVGIVNDIRHYGLGADAKPEVFVPQRQDPAYASFYVLVRTTPDPQTFISAIRREVFTVDSTQPISDLMTMHQVLAGSLARERFLMALLTILASLALVLAITGVYALVSYGVSERMHEMGVRLALGASPQGIIRLVLREVVTLTTIGLLGGLAAAWVVSDVIRGLVFAVDIRDMTTYVAVIAVLFVSAALASYLPARRAGTSDPLRTLRNQ